MKDTSRGSIASFGLFIAIGVAAVGWVAYAMARIDLSEADERFASSTARLAVLETELADALDESSSLTEELRIEQERGEDLEDEKDELEKLASVDPELLAKYSKVFFLNENYEPSGLSDIDKEYLLYPDRETQIHSKIRRDLERMIEAAEDDDVNLRIVSAYRSFDTQADLKAGYKVTYGTGANAFSAEQGYSEHQLGTTIDVVTAQAPSLTTSFDQTNGFKWLEENAYRYGFVLSYPKGNSYYQYEPWHWRFVGTDLARTLNRRDMNFYDMSQRDIDEYRASFFD